MKQKHQKTKFQKNCLLLGILFISLSIGCGAMGYRKYDWDTTDKAMMGMVVLSKTADGWTTINALSDPDNYETNVFLGKHPSDAEVIGFLALTGLLTYYFAQYMEPDVRKVFLGITSIVHIGASYNNYNLVD